MKKNSCKSIFSFLVLFYHRLLYIVATFISAASLFVSLSCGVVALTPVKGPADSAFYSMAGLISLAALVLFMLAGGIVLQLRIIRLWSENFIENKNNPLQSSQDTQ